MKQKTVEAKKETKVYETLYPYWYKNDKHLVRIMFSDRVVTDDPGMRTTVNGFLEIIKWNGPSEAATNFGGDVLNSYHKRRELEQHLLKHINEVNTGSFRV